MADPYLEISGGPNMMASLNRVSESLSTRAMDALRAEGQRIIDTAKAGMVPVDKDTLRNSGRVRDGDSPLSVVVSFGDALTSAYAITVHEHPSSFDPPSWHGVNVQFKPTGAGPKYLERPFQQAVEGMHDRISQAVIV